MASNESTTGTAAGSQVVGKVFIQYGTAKAVAADGTERALAPNSPIFAHDQIITDSDGSVSIMIDGHDGAPATQLDLGRMSHITIDEDVYAGAAPGVTADATAEADKIQQALLAGDQPIDLDATAAGGNAGAGGGVTSPFSLSLTGAVGDVNSGAGTTGPGGLGTGGGTLGAGIAVATPTVTLTTDSTDGGAGHDADFITNDGSLTFSAPAAGVGRTYTVSDGTTTTTSGSYTPPSVDGHYTVVVTDTDGNGNHSSASITYTLDTTVSASITIGGITADNVINAAEAGGNVAVTGTVGGDAHAGDAVTLTVHGVDYHGTVQTGNTFSINVLGSDLAADSNVHATVTTTDLAGNSITVPTDHAYGVDTIAPSATIAVNTITADNTINIAESHENIAVTGTVGGDAHAGDAVTLTVHGVDYHGTVQTGNTFSINVLGSDLAADSNVHATVTTSDLAGNSITVAADHGYGVDTITPVAVDDHIGVQEGASPIHGNVMMTNDLQGADAHVVAGTFEGSLGGHLLLAADGSYTYTAPAYVDHNNPDGHAPGSFADQGSVELPKSEGFAYTLIDDHGNASQATLNIAIGDTAPGTTAGASEISFVQELAGNDSVIGTYELVNGQATNLHTLITNTNDHSQYGSLGDIEAGAKLFITSGGHTYYMDASLNAPGEDHFKDGSGNLIFAVPENGEIHIEDLPISGGIGIDYNDVVLRVAQGPTVSEANLLDGTHPDAAALTVEGNLIGHQIIPGADPLTLHVGGQDLALDGSGHSIIVHSNTGDLTISDNGAWSYTLLDNTLLHHDTDPGKADGTSDGDSDRGTGDQVQDIFKLTVTDIDGDSIHPNLVININDDGPVAYNQHQTFTVEQEQHNHHYDFGHHDTDNGNWHDKHNDNAGSDDNDHWGRTSDRVSHNGETGIQINHHDNSGNDEGCTPTFQVEKGHHGNLSFDFNIEKGDGDSDTGNHTWTIERFGADNTWHTFHSGTLDGSGHVDYSWEQGNEDGNFRCVFQAENDHGSKTNIDHIGCDDSDISGNLLTGGDHLGGFGADGGHVLSVTALHDGADMSGKGHSDTATNLHDDLTVTGEHGGTLHVDSNGHYTYTPGEHQSGSETFNFTLIDGDGDTSSATLSMLIDDPNQHPCG